MSSKPRIIIINGPRYSRKSELSEMIAEHLRHADVEYVDGSLGESVFGLACQARLLHQNAVFEVMRAGHAQILEFEGRSAGEIFEKTIAEVPAMFFAKDMVEGAVAGNVVIARGTWTQEHAEAFIDAVGPKYIYVINILYPDDDFRVDDIAHPPLHVSRAAATTIAEPEQASFAAAARKAAAWAA
jgi:hypothetical protein